MERRLAPRFETPLAVQLSSERRDDGMGVMQNLSSHGCALFSRSGLSVGERVDLSFRFLERGEMRSMSGRVLRRQRVDDGVWRFLFAIALIAFLLLRWASRKLMGSTDPSRR